MKYAKVLSPLIHRALRRVTPANRKNHVAHSRKPAYHYHAQDFSI